MADEMSGKVEFLLRTKDGKGVLIDSNGDEIAFSPEEMDAYLKVFRKELRLAVSYANWRTIKDVLGDRRRVDHVT